MLTTTLRHVKDFHFWDINSQGIYENGYFPSLVRIPNRQGYIGSCRYGDASLNDFIHIIHYDDNYNLIYRKEITKGEDPRTFVFNGKPYSLTWDPNHQNILKYKLIDLIDEKVIDLNIENLPPSHISVLGKNWMTVQRDGELYIILTIDPEINILHCDVKTGDCSWVTPFDNVKRGLVISQNRGGSPFIFHKELDMYIGLGHRTYNYERHTPYLYTLSKDFKTSFIGEDIQTGRTVVEDPLSIYEHNEKIYCCVCNWLHPSGCANLYEVIVQNH